MNGTLFTDVTGQVRIDYLLLQEGAWGLLASLYTVFGTALLAIVDAEAVKRSANDMVTNARKVADATTTDENDRVLLKVVPLTADVGTDFFSVGKANTSDLPKCRVGFLGCLGLDLQADAASLGTSVQVTDLGLGFGRSARFADELINRRHTRWVPVLVP